MTQNLLNYQEVSEMLNVKVNTLYYWVHKNRIPYIRLSSRLVRFDPESVSAWLENQHVAGKST